MASGGTLSQKVAPRRRRHSISFLLFRLRLNGGDGDGIDDVGNGTTA